MEQSLKATEGFRNWTKFVDEVWDPQRVPSLVTLTAEQSPGLPPLSLDAGTRNPTHPILFRDG